MSADYLELFDRCMEMSDARPTDRDLLVKMGEHLLLLAKEALRRRVEPLNPDSPYIAGAVLASMATEFLRGQLLSADDLDLIRQQIEHCFDDIEVIDPEIRASWSATGVGEASAGIAPKRNKVRTITILGRHEKR